MSPVTAKEMEIINSFASDIARFANTSEGAIQLAENLQQALDDKLRGDACAALAMVLTVVALSSPDPRAVIFAIASVAAQSAADAREAGL